MAKKDNIRTCVVCGEVYNYCPRSCNCNKYPVWHILYHDDNCHDIWTTITADYDIHGKEYAANKLKTLDISGLDHFRSDVQDKIKMILDITDEPEVQDADLEPVEIDIDDGE